MADLYAQREKSLVAYEHAFQPLPKQVGAVFAVNGRVAGIEYFEAKAVFDRLMRKLVRSYALDAIGAAEARSAPCSIEEVQLLLLTLREAKTAIYPSVGEGVDLRLESPAVDGGALVAHERIVHLVAFAVQKEGVR